jgi:hypothetical protein
LVTLPLRTLRALISILIPPLAYRLNLPQMRHRRQYNYWRKKYRYKA